MRIYEDIYEDVRIWGYPPDAHVGYAAPPRPPCWPPLWPRVQDQSGCWWTACSGPSSWLSAILVSNVTMHQQNYETEPKHACIGLSFWLPRISCSTSLIWLICFVQIHYLCHLHFNYDYFQNTDTEASYKYYIHWLEISLSRSLLISIMSQWLWGHLRVFVT